jgi:hypothetical protein
MAEMDFAELKARFEDARNYKDRWLALYKDLYYYVIPDRDAFNVRWNYRDDGKPTTVQVFDNTAVLAAYQRANDLHALLLPKDRNWGKFVLDPHRFDQSFINNYGPLIDEINDHIFFYLNQSNLARAVSSSNLDLMGGTAGLWVESIDDDTPLVFRSIPAVALFIEYSTDDLVNTCWYQAKMSGRQILEIFPDYKGIAYEQMKGDLEADKIVIYGQIKKSEDKFCIYAVLEEDPFKPLWYVERSYPQILIYRDRVRPGETDGRGIGCDLLPTIRDLNRTAQYSLQNLAWTANPPIFYDADSYFNPHSVRQWAGAMIARRPQGRNPLEAMQMPQYPETLQKIQHLQEVIKTAFMIDPLGTVDQPVRSATEISIRENRAQRSSSTDISRLINELPKQVFEVATKILAERKLLTKDRRVGKLNVRKLRFDFQSPLFDLQKQDDLNHFITNMQIKQQFFGQEAAMTSVNLTNVQDFLTDNLNLKKNLFASGEQLQQYIQQAAQMAQQAQLPKPTTAAASVQFPQQSNVQI